MMRSLWSGVSGLNAHQVAMDVEANNIANVNTVGFKYSRTNFQNLLSQTVKSATAPQGDLGGKNSLQIGLGSTVSSVETMFKQGSIQNTDKNTDMAINGDGFFIVSADGGKTYRYTRAGDFTFDAEGNFVDPNGFIVQGWMADPDTHNIDTASGVKPISIPPGLTTPAKETSKIQIKANLNSGDHITEMAGSRATVDAMDDLNNLYDATGNVISLTADKDKVTFVVTRLNGTKDTLTLTYSKSTSDHDKAFTTIKDLIDELNYDITHDSTGKVLPEVAKYNASEYSVFLNGDGQIVVPTVNASVTYSSSTETDTNNTLGQILAAINQNGMSESIKAIQNSFIGADDVGELFNSNGDALNLKDGQGLTVSIDGLYETRKFVYTSSDINGGSEGCSTNTGSYLGSAITSDSNEGLHWTYDSNGNKAAFSVVRDSNNKVVGHNKVEFKVHDTAGDTHTYTFYYGMEDNTGFHTISDLVCRLNEKLQNDDIPITVTYKDGKIVESDSSGASIDSVSVYTDSNSTAAVTDTSPLGNVGTILSGLDGNGTESNVFQKKDIYYFHNIEDLVNLWQMAVDDSNDLLGNENAINGVKANVFLDENGKLAVSNVSGNSFGITVSGYPDADTDNALLTEAFSSINGTVANGATTYAQPLNAAVHTTSIDIFDSLGSKHTLTLHFRKSHTSTSPVDPTVWKWYAEVPEPSTLDDPAYGEVKFNSDGSINSFNPPTLVFNANNGSTPGQSIQLDLGTLGEFDGLTSFEAPSATSGQTQDGYPGGDLQQLVVDQTGTIIGVFTNGRSYSLAQVALAKFVNNEGLMSEGGTLFSASPNSGEPIIGTAGTGGRGSIQPSALEMSNVDLSRSLTQLIVIQRGFQANSKTITTSDQMLNTLLQLKQ
ncbi:MAG: flagellar hook-basal body complex protein [Nautiliaceae bacterium]